jgi:hypothetical protein
MPPSRDDPEIRDETLLLRVLLQKWTCIKNGRERPTSDSMLDSNFENSCFIEGEIAVGEVQSLFPDLKIARIGAMLIRREGFAIERRPDEAPDNCSNRSAHVVVGPIVRLDRGRYERAARTIVRDASVEIVSPPQVSGM